MDKAQDYLKPFAVMCEEWLPEGVCCNVRRDNQGNVKYIKLSNQEEFDRYSAEIDKQIQEQNNG